MVMGVILGTASGAQNVGLFGPDLVGGDFSQFWVYVIGPLADAVTAVAIGFVLGGQGGGRAGSGAAQGDLFTEVADPSKP